MHVHEVRPRKDKRGIDLISDVLPFGDAVRPRTDPHTLGFFGIMYCSMNQSIALHVARARMAG
jgi:hypothetical protein